MGIHKFGSLGFGGMVLLVPQAAFAHSGAHTAGDAASSFWFGVLHPLAGLDHLCTMVMVGVLAWQLGGRALYLLPAAFVAMMLFGGALGVYGVPLSLAEGSIALSMVGLGAMVALGIRLPTALAAAMVGLIAVLHGHVHGAEMPATAAGLAYGLGFTITTLGLQAVGIVFGRTISRIRKQNVVRTSRNANSCQTIHRPM